MAIYSKPENYGDDEVVSSPPLEKEIKNYDIKYGGVSEEEKTDKENSSVRRQDFLDANYGYYSIHPINEPENESKKYRSYYKLPRFENVMNLPLAYCYARCSTYESQVKKGYSIETQESEMMEYCKKNNLFIKFIAYDAGRSGKSMKGRHSIQKILNEIEPKSTFLCLEMSRVSRDDRDFENITYEIRVAKRCKIFYVRDINPDLNTSEGYSLQAVKKLTNGLESREISRRTKLAMRAAAARGEAKPRPAYGYRFVKKGYPYEKDPYEQSVITFMKEYKKKHPYSTVQEVLESLESANLNPPKNAKRWYPATVKNIMIQNNIMKPTTFDD